MSCRPVGVLCLRIPPSLEAFDGCRGQFAHTPQSPHPGLARVFADLPVVPLRLRPQLEHVTQHRDRPAPRPAGLTHQVVHRGPHGGGIGVVRVVDDGQPRQTQDVTPASAQSRRGEPFRALGDRQTRCIAGRGGCRRILNVMSRHIGSLDLGLTPGPRETQDVPRSPNRRAERTPHIGRTRGSMQAKPHDRAPDCIYIWLQNAAFRRNDHSAALSHARCKLSLGLSDILQRPQKLKVDWMDVGDHSDVGFGDLSKSGYLSAAPHPHLHHHRLGIRSDAEKGERHAHFVVLVRSRHHQAADASHHGAQEVFCAGLADAAGHREHDGV